MELTPIFSWWLVTTLFGLIGWPIAFNLLKNLPDRGFAVARVMGLLLTGYLLWLGGTFRLLQNNLSGILIAMTVMLTIGLMGRWRANPTDARSMRAWLKREWRYVLSVELLFNLAFIGWVMFKSYNPNIETAGGEKWMEIAFINGTLRSDYFPPQDPWLSGFAISYYYFGYVLMALMTQLTGIVATTAFNLYIPTLFALTLIGAFGIVANLVSLHQRRLDSQADLPSAITLAAMLTGFASAMFVGFLGNLIGVFEVLHKRGLMHADFWQWLDIRDLKNPPVPSDNWIPDRFIWWWRGSRVLTDYNLAGNEQEVIDEFPFFSFLLGDVHPHVLALPFVLLVVMLALNLLHQRAVPFMGNNAVDDADTDSWLGSVNHFLRQQSHHLLTAVGGRFQFMGYAVIIGSLGFLNTWDFPIYLSIIGLTFIAWYAPQTSNWQAAILPALISSGLLAFSSIMLYLPFYLTFQSQAGGILPNLWNPTHLPQFFVFFGTFLVAAIGLLIAVSLQQRAWVRHLMWTLPLMVMGPLVVMGLVLGAVLMNPSGQQFFDGILNNLDFQQHIGGNSMDALLQTSLSRRMAAPFTFLLLSGLLAWTIALLVGFTQTPSDHRSGWQVEQFALILLLIGLLLPLTVEFIFLRDNFGYRMNTIFKFYFQAWVLLALAAGFGLYYVTRNLRGYSLLIWHASMLILIVGSLIYPLLALLDKTNYFDNEPTLNGIAWISHARPADYAGIEWLGENALAGAVLLEAPGSGFKSYHYVGRVSALTGIPTLLGWGGHQHQWRGNYDEPGRREPDIERLFNSKDTQQTQALLDHYNITYVYIGPLEREQYNPLALQKFDLLMDVAFQEGDVTIYQRR